jgi:hypothetical protein
VLASFTNLFTHFAGARILKEAFVFLMVREMNTRDDEILNSSSLLKEM